MNLTEPLELHPNESHSIEGTLNNDILIFEGNEDIVVYEPDHANQLNPDIISVKNPQI